MSIIHLYVKKLLYTINTKPVLKTLAPFLTYFYYNSFGHHFLDQDYRLFWIERKKTKSDDHLELYWKSENAPNRKKLIAVILKLISQYPSDSVSILEYGSHVGINIRMLSERVPKRIDARYYAIEPNPEAYEFMLQKMPFIKGLLGEDSSFIRDKHYPGDRIDLSFISGVFYAMPYKRVIAVLKKIASISNTIVIADEIAGFFGKRTQYRKLFDMNGKMYFSLAHPYAKMLKRVGCSQWMVYRVPIPQIATSGIIVARMNPIQKN